MARSRLNLLRYYAKIVEITNAHYIEGFTYSYVWRKYVYPVYPVSYDTYMRIINYPRLQQELEDLETRRTVRYSAGATRSMQRRSASARASTAA